MKKSVYQKPSWKDLDMEIEGMLLLVSGQNEVFESDGTYGSGWDDED